MPTANEEVLLEKLWVDPADLDSISKELQREDDISLLVVRDLFKGVMEKFQSLFSHISHGKRFPVQKIVQNLSQTGQVKKRYSNLSYLKTVKTRKNNF